MKPLIIALITIVVISGIVIGLVAYSYTQIHLSLADMSFAGFDWNLSSLSLLKLGVNLLTGNILGSILSVITGIKINLIFALANQGIFPVYIPNLSYDLFVNDFKIGHGNSNVDLTINPGETKNLPVLQDFTFSSLEPVTASVIASNGIMDVKVSGTAYFKFLGLSIPIPFESTRQVSIVDEAKKYINEKLSGQSSSNYQTPSVHTGISFQASSYSVYQDQSVTLSGQLTDSNGNGIANQLVYAKRDIRFLLDPVLGTTYTDSNGYFSIDWTATKPITSNTANVYATFDGNSGYSNARSDDISIQVYVQQTQTTAQNPQYQSNTEQNTSPLFYTPTQISPPNNSVFTNYPRTTTLTWSSVPGAKSYAVQIDVWNYDNSKWSPFITESGITGTSYTFNFVAVQPGAWRVLAVDDSGKVSLPSGWWQFKYAG